MYSLQLLSSFLLLGAAVAAPTSEDPVALSRRQVPVKTCSHITGGVHVIAVGGANTADEKAYGYLASLATSILNAIPGSTNVSVPYDKVFASLDPPKLQPGAVAGGMNTLKQYTVDYHHYCPHTKMVLIGYSSGGVIVMNDLCYGGNGVHSPQINPLLNDNTIIATVVYGEETRVPGQYYNRGTCTNYGGTAPRANPSLCNPFAANIASYCDLGDSDCCVGSGDDLSVHLSYPRKYDALATEFVVGKFKYFGNGV
jgi:hypothetical protein